RWIADEGFTEEICSVYVVEAFMEEPSPTHFNVRLGWAGRCGESKLFVRLVPFFEAPEAFCTKPRIGAASEDLETQIRVAQSAMLVKSPAGIGRGSLCGH